VKIVKEHATSGGNKPLFPYYAMLEPHVSWLPIEEFVGKSKRCPRLTVVFLGPPR